MERRPLVFLSVATVVIVAAVAATYAYLPKEIIGSVFGPEDQAIPSIEERAQVLESLRDDAAPPAPLTDEEKNRRLDILEELREIPAQSPSKDPNEPKWTPPQPEAPPSPSDAEKTRILKSLQRI